MAKLYGLNGIIRGRQGNNVYSVQNGTQVLKVYQPAVSNPRTMGQREQRSKFALAGKMSSATPSMALLGLPGSSPRSRRAKFVSMLTLVATVSGSADNLIAAIPYDSVVYSIGSLARYSGVPTVSAEFTGAAAGSSVVATVSALYLSPNPPQGYGELVICALYDEAGSRLDEVQVAVRSTANPTVFTFRQGRRRNCYVVTYVAPFKQNTALGRPNSVGLAGTETNATLNTSTLTALSGAEWGVSQLVAVTPVLGTSNAIAPAGDGMREVVEQALEEHAVAEGKKKK